jgi:hypothetical protein
VAIHPTIQLDLDIYYIGALFLKQLYLKDLVVHRLQMQSSVQ